MVSYTVDGAYEGRGYASEAVAAVIAYARDVLGLVRLTAYYEPANVRSERLLLRNGFSVIAQTPVVPGFERLMRVQNIAALDLRAMSREALDALRVRVHDAPAEAARLAAVEDGGFADAVLALAAHAQLGVTRADLDAALAAGRHAWLLRWVR